MKTMGVLGGMGPLATVYFMQCVMRLTSAARDQDHIPMIVNCAPQIPDRGAAIAQKGTSPLDELRTALALLERCEVDFVCMPCNTAHFWYPDLVKNCSVPFIHIADAVVGELLSSAHPRARVGLLATSGTIQGGIYQGRDGACFQWLVPEEAIQNENVMGAIRYIKGGMAKSALPLVHDAVSHLLHDKQAQILVLGCTELSIIVGEDSFDVPVIDSTLALARQAITQAIFDRGPEAINATSVVPEANNGRRFLTMGRES
jgi:aspartate racemase